MCSWQELFRFWTEVLTQIWAVKCTEGKKYDKLVLVKQKQWIQHLLEADFEEKLSLKLA